MSLDINQLREDTPGTKSVFHFNNAGSSLPTQKTLDEITKYLQIEGTLGGYEVKEKFLQEIQQCYDEAAKLINCQADEIAIVSNASDAFNKALYAISFNKGDIILTSEVEYGNNYLNFLNIQREKGIEFHIVPNDEFGNIMLEKLESMISPNVKLIAITHIPTNSGLVVPVEKIGAIAKKNDILYLVDACQSVGQLPVDVNNIQCDFLSATSRKYLRGPRGLGFLYVKKELLQKLNPPSLDMVAAHWQDEKNFTLDIDIKMFEHWEKSFALILGLKEAIRYLNELGVENTWQRIQFLANDLREKFSKIQRVKVLDIGAQKCGIVSFQIDGIPSGEVVKTLSGNKINISASLRFSTVLDMDKRGLTGVNRASVHYYNTEEEIDFLVSKIKEIASLNISQLTDN